MKMRIPELLADEVRNLVLGGRLEARPAPADAAETVADVAVTWETYEGGRPVPGARRAGDGAVRAGGGGAGEADAVRGRGRRDRAARPGADRGGGGGAAGEYVEAREVMVLFQEAVSRARPRRGRERRGENRRPGRERRGVRGSRAYRSSMRKGGSREVVTLYQSEAAEDLRSMGQAKTTRRRTGWRTRSARRASRGRRRQQGALEGAAGLARKRSKRW